MKLREAVASADWAKLFAEHKTHKLASASWAASAARCSQLRRLCSATRAKRVLEIGSFAGVSSLAMAEALPDNGEVVALENDPFMVDFGLDIKVESNAFWKISHMVGSAWNSLQSLIQQMEDEGSSWEPFDLALIDTNGAGTMEYFEILSQVPGLLTDSYVICLSGGPEIDALRGHVSCGAFECSEDDGLLQVCKKVSLTIASNPLAAFANCYENVSGRARWAAPQQAYPAAEFRRVANDADQGSWVTEQKTHTPTSASQATPQQAHPVAELCKVVSDAEIASALLCGVASLAAMAMIQTCNHSSDSLDFVSDTMTRQITMPSYLTHLSGVMTRQLTV